MKTFTIRMGRDKFKFRIIPERKTVYGTLTNRKPEVLMRTPLDFAGTVSIIEGGGFKESMVEASVTCAEGDTWDPVVGLGVCLLKLIVKKYTKKNWYRFKELMKSQKD